MEIRRRFKPFAEDELSSLVKGTVALAGHPGAPTACPRNIDGPATITIGPEGGFIPYEIDLLARAGFLPVSFGTRTLRVEQAIPFIAGKMAGIQ